MILSQEKFKELEDRIKVLEDALKAYKSDRCENPIKEKVTPTEYKEHWKLHDCGNCRSCKARKALEVK